jgi:hypothetical protein
MQPAKRASQKPFHTFKSIHNRVNIYQTGDFDVHSSTNDNRVNIYQTGDFDADLKYKMVDTI